ncbi:LysM peptidoglycan-binding domain-containing protein [Bergeriella denitrificans]|uniref:Periplasmic protein (Possibly peptidoglycan-binding) n=1 Tax=Bergeriella denitrificans TaxID=494 RepID=A0A378UKJ3_BERDE|nr:LysM domain-containing protein [Bergeriella denitrificans]STZ77223.1 periplasmic protein (possibly peptidoglycan-binding) [Bergeriella denitrificans]
MKRAIITLLCAAGLAISASAAASALQIRPDAPQRYTVKPGDTLWGIAGKYLYSPWQWNHLWGANRSAVANPHLIYPGQVLVLRHENGRPVLGFDNGSLNSDGIPTVRLSPRLRESSGYGIPTVNVDFYRLFMQHPQIIPPTQTADAPRLVEGPDSRLLYTQGHRVYAYGVDAPGRYLTYRINKNITSPDTGKILGQEAVFSGIVRTLPYTDSALANRTRLSAEKLNDDEYYTRENALIRLRTRAAQPMVVETAIAEIRRGDYLLKMPEGIDSFHMMPHAPLRPVQAKVVSIFNGVGEAGQFQTITLDKGEADGLDKGAVLGLYKRGRQIRTDFRNNLAPAPKSRDVVEAVSIPTEEIGLAMVYRTAENLSSAIILESLSGIKIGDTAAEPGRDLDNMADEKTVEPQPMFPDTETDIEIEIAP